MSTRPVPAAPPLQAAPLIASDVHPLRTVLLHRPGAELSAVTPEEPSRALFDAPVDLFGARRDHDAFAAALRERGAEVLLVEELLADVLAQPATGRALLDAALAGHDASVRTAVAQRAPAAAARALIGGLREDGRTLLDPLPNLLFTRDAAAWVGDRGLAGAMAAPVRRREAALVAALFALHPAFAGAPVEASPAAPFEGGDVLVAGDGRVLLGLSERTSAAGARAVVARLLASGTAGEVVTLTVPEGAGFHLDLILTLVDRETYAVWAPVRAALRGHRWRRHGDGVRATEVADPLRGARVIPVDGSDAGAHGRRWDHGVNLLALAPGVVVGYADNVGARAQLEAAGIEVVPVPGTALGAGRGGPRCLSCPIRRG